MHPHAHPGGAGHAHAHTPDAPASHSASRRLSAAVTITGSVLVAELIAASLSGSLALAADAGHMAVDSTGLLVALAAARLAAAPRTDNHSWGYARAEVLAAGFQAGMLLVLTALIAFESITRLLSPSPIDPGPVLVVGTIGLLANIASILVLAGGRGENLNIRAAFLEVANDALGSLAVIASAIIAWASGWSGADAAASLLIAALMIPRAWTLLRASGSILLEAAPAGLDTSGLRSRIEALDGVEDVHDLHVSTISTGVITLTAHLRVAPTMSAAERDALVATIREDAATSFPIVIGHTTIEVESATDDCACALVHP